MALGASLPALKSSAVELGPPSDPQVLQVQVPSFFLCPIHLGIMKDPVTLSTGITYDRRSIEKWLDGGHNTCPSTKQILESCDLIPNHTLHRAIQNWRAANPAAVKKGVEPEAVQTVLETIEQCTDASSYHFSLKQLYVMSEECRRNRKTLKEAGAVPVLVDALTILGSTDRVPPSHPVSRHLIKGLEYAVATTALLDLDDEDRQAMAAPPTFTILCSLLATGSSKAKINAAEVIHFVCGEDANLKAIVGKYPGAIKGLVTVLKEEKLTAKEIKLGLRCLMSLSLSKKNRVIAIDARAVHALVELIPKAENTRNVEYCCGILEVLANCAEGREAISSHPFAIPRLVASLLGVSNLATEHAVGALLVVIELASNRSVIKTALRAGAFTKLLMILPSDCSQRAKSKARDTLKLLNEVWGTYTSRPDDDSSIIIERGSVRQRPHFNAES
ncbi:hypothetical protein KC19_1G312400 [Ceratodon purpureus]|uniref:RING-type E3 ubiquitin transferase n=1 Tax=Ceratodon purpureus TaxID=3225 RepID=A0A8T0JCY9_CERPU|nr:hypothetical protein KC19_1G312400 [Ceratodon purpureus]